MWNFNSDKPIYCQLIEQFRLKILSGEYPPGSKVASVRELAHEACVNPNTVQRAFSELEREGLVYTQRTSGRYITADQELISRCRSRTAAAKREQTRRSRAHGHWIRSHPPAGRYSPPARGRFCRKPGSKNVPSGGSSTRSLSPKKARRLPGKPCCPGASRSAGNQRRSPQRAAPSFFSHALFTYR